MNIERRISRFFFCLVTALIILQACSRDDRPDYRYFVSSTPVAGYSEAFINGLLDYAGQASPEIIPLKQHVAGGASVFKIVYRTTVNGKKIEASGLVSVPGEPGTYPVLSFQNGTNTINANCPSNDPDNFMYLVIECIASMGFVVIIPDYPGFGSSASIPHPYLLAEPTVISITDMFRAVNEAVEDFSDVRLKNEYYLTGYSQGGWATMALHKYLETEVPDEFKLAASVCGAGPYDLTRVLTEILSKEVYPHPAYLGYIINAYTYYGYIKNKVTELLNEPYASRLPLLFDGKHYPGEINLMLSSSIPTLINKDLLDGYYSDRYSSVRASLVQNSIGPYKTKAPLLFVHGDADTQVPVSVTESFVRDMINAGTNASICQKKIVPGLEHDQAVIPYMTEGLGFLFSVRGDK